MKNIIYFLIVFLLGTTQEILCSDNISTIVNQLSTIPLHENANNFKNLNRVLKKKIEEKTKTDRSIETKKAYFKFYKDYNETGGTSDQDVEKDWNLEIEKENQRYEKFVNIIDSWPKEVKSQEDYVHLIYKYFRLIYANQIKLIGEDVTESWKKNAYILIKSYKEEDGLFKKLSPIFSSESKQMLKDGNEFDIDIEEDDFKEFIKNNSSSILNDLELIKMFDMGSPAQQLKDTRFVYSNVLSDGKVNPCYADSLFCNLLRDISEPLYKDEKSTIEKILCSIKEIENATIWRDILFGFNPHVQLTLDYVKNAFYACKFHGKQFSDIKKIDDIAIVINDRIKSFDEKLEEFSNVKKKNSSLEDNEYLLNDEDGVLVTHLKSRVTVEIENLKLRISRLKQLLHEYNNLPEVKPIAKNVIENASYVDNETKYKPVDNETKYKPAENYSNMETNSIKPTEFNYSYKKRLKWGIGIGISSALLVLILILKKAGYFS